ncbi:hypothetical protein GEMRC1_005129 [Eukaryota sp. GEM-RC1]
MQHQSQSQATTAVSDCSDSDTQDPSITQFDYDLKTRFTPFLTDVLSCSIRCGDGFALLFSYLSDCTLFMIILLIPSVFSLSIILDEAPRSSTGFLQFLLGTDLPSELRFVTILSCTICSLAFTLPAFSFEL